MTTTPPDAPSGPEAPRDQGPRVTRDEVRDLGRLRRSSTDRKVAGVAGGLARHLDVDPIVLRVAFVVLVFFGGAGLILYGACWLLVPVEGSDSAPVHLDDRSRGIALLIVGILAAAALVGDSWSSWFPWPVAIIALVVLIVVTRREARHQAPPPSSPPSYQPTAQQPVQPPYQPSAQPTWQQPAAGQPATLRGWQGTAAQPSYPQGPGGYPPPPAWTPPPRPPRAPRKPGPILFWFTLALIVLAEGVLGIVDGAGADVTGSAYPALAVGITGLMLLLGAFWGRAGGLVLVGLVSTAVLAGATAADNWDGERLERTPMHAAGVWKEYRIDAGELVLDLRQVTDPEELDGRTIRVAGDVGHLEVIVPPHLTTRVVAQVDGPGNIDLFGEDSGGIDIAMTRRHQAGPKDPSIVIDADLSVGQIEVHQ